jgi:tetrahydromethanopterin S-methyltransferase subunit C
MDRLLSLSRDPQDHVAIALAGSALCLEPVDHVRRQPDVTLAALVDVILMVDLPSGSVAAIASKAASVIAILIIARPASAR